MLSIRHILVSFSAILFFAQIGSTQVITSNPGLPPNTGAYMTPGQVHADYSVGGLSVVLSQVSHEPLAVTAVVDDPISKIETETFNSQATGMISINGNTPGPFTLLGPVTVQVFGKDGNVTGTFNTQMTSMDLTGTVSGHLAKIMLDSNNSTNGQTSITSVGGGMYQISSFFDVFTELSLDGSPFSPQINGPTLVQLEPIPEPASLGLVGTGGLLLLRRRRTSH